MTKTILIVDDEPDLRELTRISLELIGGHRVLAASSGEEAIAINEAQALDAIVLDVQMPGMDGPATLRALLTGGGQLPPTVFMTASALVSELEALRRLPVAGVLTKPFDPMTLPSTLEELLGWS